jgi:hypothetical protein
MKKQYLSAYSLFNFTSKWDYFEDKITNGFRPRFVLEDFSPFNYNVKIAFPMVCFCDILISQLKEHMEEYGTYGIGLSKEWGRKHGLNPLLYISSNSSHLLDIVKINKNIIDKISLCKNCHDNKYIDTLKYSINSLLRYLKPCEGVQKGKKRIFYDEKEWRFLLQDENLFVLDEKTFNDVGKREAKNKQITETIGFESNDIQYFIVKNKKDVDKLITLLEKRFPKDYKYLSTRIIVKKDIENDF